MFDFSISEIICVILCGIHILISFLNVFLQKKQITSICKKCFTPVIDGEKHNCLSPEQLDMLNKFVSSVLGDVHE